MLTKEQIKRGNARTAELLSLYLNLTPDAIKPDMVREMAEFCGFSNARAYTEILAVLCGVDAAGDDKEYFRNFFLPMVKELDVSGYESDPYYKSIHFHDNRYGKWQLTNMRLAPCEAFICNDFEVTDDKRMIPQLGFFMQDFIYPAILENGREWMTLLPNETTTTKPAIQNAHGKVLTYGLGLGYFIYMCLLKDDVESVTAVEVSKEAAALFKEHILPQFERRDKVNIIVADAYEYAQNTAPYEDYDFIFADIWHDVGDGREPYRRFKSMEPLYKSGTEFAYWLEKSILCYENRELW